MWANNARAPDRTCARNEASAHFATLALPGSPLSMPQQFTTVVTPLRSISAITSSVITSQSAGVVRERPER